MAKTEAAKERLRCIKIVQDYRRELTRAYTSKPFASNAKQVLALIHKLQDMEQKMAQVPNPTTSLGRKPKALPDGDFSIEEIERAQEIIREQERNPFDEV